MYRVTIPLLLAITIAFFWLSRPVNAFTLRLGPVSGPEASSSIPDVGGNELPAPQLLRMAISRNGMTFGVVHPSTGYQAPQTEIHYQDVQVSQAPVPQNSDQLSALATTPRLSGAELLLLRQTEIVVDR